MIATRCVPVNNDQSENMSSIEARTTTGARIAVSEWLDLTVRIRLFLPRMLAHPLGV
jgi:hypothetical protein